MITEEKYRKAIDRKDEAEKIINSYHREKYTRFQERLENGEPFTDDELLYAATNRCPCGHGLAYPKDCSPSHYWDCSAILKGIADKTVKHCGQLPFMMYEIKSDDQPSAFGKTTREPLEKNTQEPGT